EEDQRRDEGAARSFSVIHPHETSFRRGLLFLAFAACLLDLAAHFVHLFAYLVDFVADQVFFVMTASIAIFLLLTALVVWLSEVTGSFILSSLIVGGFFA
ncbi:hypothetical protein NE555_16735, partial [Alistipes onderdonkii]|nr:hypothetical protein [Alistipes onderdonkii]